MAPRRTTIAVGLALAAVGIVGAGVYWRNHNVGDVERGFRLAVSNGCIRCHGTGGMPSGPDPARDLGGAPSFGTDDVRNYSHSESEIREWILDGKPRRLRNEEAGETPALLTMPAFRGRLDEGEVRQLVAWIKAISDFDLSGPGSTPEGPAERGRILAQELGCTSCHGPQGRGNAPNAGSLKGYIPSWDGADFPELVATDAEFREWVRDGRPTRLARNPIARFFLDRQLIRMPAYDDRVSNEELEALLAYVHWLRRPASGGQGGVGEASP